MTLFQALPRQDVPAQDLAPQQIATQTAPLEESALSLSWGEQSITATSRQRPIGRVCWEPRRSTAEVDLAVQPQDERVPERLSELLDVALAHLGRTGVDRVHMTLTAGEPMTPALLSIVRGAHPERARGFEAEGYADVVDVQVRSAGHSALVDLTLRPGTLPQ